MALFRPTILLIENRCDVRRRSNIFCKPFLLNEMDDLKPIAFGAQAGTSCGGTMILSLNFLFNTGGQYPPERPKMVLPC